MTDTTDQTGTVESDPLRADSPPVTGFGSSGIGALSKEYAELRDDVELLWTDVSEGHRRSRAYDLADRAGAKARRSVTELLGELAEGVGLAWADIARLVGVTVSSVRKWRTGEAPSGAKRAALAQLVAFLDLVGEFPVADVAGWMETPLVAGYTATPIDLYRAGATDLLLEFAAGRIDVTPMLDEFDARWRERYSSDFEVVDTLDGQRSIRRRGG